MKYAFYREKAFIRDYFVAQMLVWWFVLNNQVYHPKVGWRLVQLVGEHWLPRWTCGNISEGFSSCAANWATSSSPRVAHSWFTFTEVLHVFVFPFHFMLVIFFLILFFCASMHKLFWTLKVFFCCWFYSLTLKKAFSLFYSGPFDPVKADVVGLKESVLGANLREEN